MLEKNHLHCSALVLLGQIGPRTEWNFKYLCLVLIIPGLAWSGVQCSFQCRNTVLIYSMHTVFKIFFGFCGFFLNYVFSCIFEFWWWCHMHIHSWQIWTVCHSYFSLFEHVRIRISCSMRLLVLVLWSLLLLLLNGNSAPRFQLELCPYLSGWLCSSNQHKNILFSYQLPLNHLTFLDGWIWNNNSVQ